MDPLILLQACLYFCIFVSGFLVCVPVGVNRTRFDGQCILYGEVEKLHVNLIVGSSPSNCDFPIYFGIFGMILIGLLGCLCFGYFALKSRTDSDVKTGLWTVPFIPLNAILSIITMVTACMLSVGIKVFCDNYEEHNSSCSDLENTRFILSGTNTGNFLTGSSVSQAGGWMGFILYVIQTGIGVWRFFQNRKKK